MRLYTNACRPANPCIQQECSATGPSQVQSGLVRSALCTDQFIAEITAHLFNGKVFQTPEVLLLLLSNEMQWLASTVQMLHQKL